MLLAVAAFFTAALGTLLGVGGGFIFVPLLLYLYPSQPHAWIVALSLWLVAFNASSGAIAYWRKGRIHLRAALVFILAALPGSILGVWFEKFVSRGKFETIFGVAMVLYAAYMFFKKVPKDAESVSTHTELAPRFYFLGAFISFFVGFLAAFLGIGGGVIHVPLLVFALGFSVHLATGTSMGILAVTALFATLTHLWRGDIAWNDPALWQIAVAAALGAQGGAYLSHHVPGRLILRLLSVVLLVAGARLIAQQF